MFLPDLAFRRQLTDFVHGVRGDVEVMPRAVPEPINLSRPPLRDAAGTARNLLALPMMNVRSGGSDV